MFKQEIGLNSVNFDAPGNLGTKVRIVELVDEGRKAEWKKWVIEVMISSPTEPQAALKNPEVSPSGPGALFGFSLTSSFEFLHLLESTTSERSVQEKSRSVGDCITNHETRQWREGHKPVLVLSRSETPPEHSSP